MRSSYNYTIVERHKQKIFIPYVGLEFSGWSILLWMLAGVIGGIFLIGFPLSMIFGEIGYIIALGLVAVLEVFVVTYLTEIDRESGKSKLMTMYYTHVKNYRMIYDSHGKMHYLSKKKEGVVYRVCR